MKLQNREVFLFPTALLCSFLRIPYPSHPSGYCLQILTKAFVLTVTHISCFFVFLLLLQLQAPSVKGFDFAKQHLGQHNKEDVLIIHEPAPLPGPIKDTTLSENGDVPSPKSKASSKPSKTVRHRGRSVHRGRKTSCGR